jgi:flagellin-like protein
VAAVSLNSNLAALRAKRALNASSAELSSTLERLSSGKRINQASDDAAGLAVSSTLNATARVYTQAARNVNDGISFLNVADGACSALKDILFRLRELSTQSSNGTFSNTQRQSLDSPRWPLLCYANRPKPNDRVTSRKVEAFDFAEEPKGEKKRAKTAVRVGKRSRIHGDFVSPDRKAKSTDRRRSRCKCCVVRIFGYFAAHDVNVGFRPR